MECLLEDSVCSPKPIPRVTSVMAIGSGVIAIMRRLPLGIPHKCIAERELEQSR